MHRTPCRILLFLVVLAAAAPAIAQQQPDPDSPRYLGVVALDEFLSSDDTTSIDAFVESRIAASVRESMGDEALVETLAALRAAAAGAQFRGARPVGPLAAELVFDLADGNEMVIDFELDEQDTDRFAVIRAPEHRIG